MYTISPNGNGAQHNSDKCHEHAKKHQESNASAS